MSYVSRTPVSSHSRNPRRMTLGGLPSASDAAPRTSNLRRQSIDPSSAAASGIPNNSKSSSSSTRRPPKGRVSMIPRVGRENAIPSTPGGGASVASAKSTASSRRRSVGPEAGASSVTKQRRPSLVPPPSSQQQQRADPRPVNDKSFQHQCIKELLSFLLERGYEYPVSAKSLSRPSAKDFTNIATFMLRQIDKDFGRGTMKFEDEVSLNFKVMGYPYTVSKTSLVAAGSPHTWPSLLAALTWLMHHLQGERDGAALGRDADARFESIEELHTKSERDFFRFVGDAYKAWMRNDKVALEEVEAAFAEGFEEDNAFVAQTAERVTDLNATILERIHEMEEQAQGLGSYAEKRESYATDLEQFHDLIRQMDEHKSQQEQKVKERTAELAETNSKLDRMTTYINELKQTIKEQEFSVDDIHKMESELKGLSEASDRAHAALDQQRKMLLASEKELVSVSNNLDSMTTSYNARVSALQLVPELSSTFAPFKAQLDKEKLLETNQTRIVGVDLIGTVQSAVRSAKDEFAATNHHDETTYNELVDQLNRSEDACKEAQAKVKIVEDKKAKCDHTMESEEETLQKKLTVRKREVETMENKVAALQDPVALEEQMAAYERQCAELEALRVEHEEENVAKYQAVLDEVSRACQAMADHDAYVRQRVSDLDEFWREQQEGATPDIVVPANLDLSGGGAE